MDLREQRQERPHLDRLVARLALDDRHDAPELGAIRGLWRSTEHHRANSVVQVRQGVRLITSGWAGWARPVEDGRRLIFLFLLPGDFIPSSLILVEDCDVVALTPLRTVDATPLLDRGADGRLVAPHAHGLAGEANATYRLLLLDQLTRLARGNTMRNLAHLLLEFRRRMTGAGACPEARFALPIGQRVIAQALGRSAVQINKAFNRLREDGLIAFDNGEMELRDPARLQTLAAFNSVTVHF